MNANITVSEKGIKRFLELSNVVNFEIRQCTNTNNNDNDNNNTARIDFTNNNNNSDFWFQEIVEED